MTRKSVALQSLAVQNTVPPDLPVSARKRQTRGLKQGNPGNKGGGRKPKAYKLWLASLLDSETHRKQFAEAVEDKGDAYFMAATRHAAEYAHGKPEQAVSMKGGIELVLRKASE